MCPYPRRAAGYSGLQFAANATKWVWAPLSPSTWAAARVKARECRQLLLGGKDPLAERRASRASHALKEAKRITFDQCAAQYIDVHRGTWKNAKHVMQWENTLATYASPLINGLAVADVETDLVVKVLNPIWRSKTETAVPLRGRIECILDWATTRKFRQGENPARWRGHLENLLANQISWRQ